MTTRPLGAWCLAALGLALAACIPSAARGSEESAALDAVIRDVCQKDIILLGEDANHGSGKTLEIKTRLVRKLVEECHFSAVFFESQIYDFIDLQHAFDDKTAVPDHVAATIGGLWSKASESAPLVDYLFRQARGGRITLAGIDPQIGGATQRYSQHRLPAALALHLTGARRTTCETELTRLTNWQYDDTNRYDGIARARLRGCLTDIQSATSRHASGNRTAAEAGQMTVNLLRYLDMADGHEFNVRDRAMFDNFGWQLSRLPKGAKVIVWSATVHAVKNAMPNGADVPMGYHVHQAYGDRAAAIGFTALTGSFGRPGKTPTALDTATPQSLEGRVFAQGNGDIRYVDRAQLTEFGSIQARALNYRKSEPAHWATLLDGVIVLREEQPMQQVSK